MGIKLLYIRKEFPKASETFILNELIELENLGADIRVLAEKQFDDVTQPGYIERKFLQKTIYDQSYYDELRPNQFRPDVIICSFGTLSNIKTASILSKLLDAPFVVIFRAQDIYVGLGEGIAQQNFRALKRSVERDMVRPLLNDAAAIFTTSEENRLTLIHEHNLRRDITVYHSGVDPTFFRPSNEEVQKQETVLCVSRFEEKKGIEDLITAFHSVKQKHPRMKLKIIGFGPLLARYRERIESLSLTDSCEIHGPVDSSRILREMREAMLFVLPSIITASGNRDVLATSLQEAMAAGMPVITTNLPGNEELVEDRSSGLIVEMGNVAQITEAINLIIENQALRRRLEVRARETILKRFTMKAEIARVYKTLSNLKPYRGVMTCLSTSSGDLSTS